MCADEECATLEAWHILVRYGVQAELLEALHLHAVVYDVAQRVDIANPL